MHILILASMTLAQSNYTTIPQGYRDQEGVYNGVPFGAYASSRSKASTVSLVRWGHRCQ